VIEAKGGFMAEREIISFDYAIKNILRDKANFDILSGFLSELLGKNVEVQNILESESNSDKKDGKINRLDLKAQIDGGELVIFEIQYFDQADFLGKILFNASKTIVEQVGSGQFYDIKKVYSVNIAYYNLPSDQEYVFRARLTHFQGVNFPEIMPFSQNLNPPLPATELHPEYFLILPKKFDNFLRSRFDQWVYVLKNSAVKSEFDAAGIQKAAEKLDVLKMTDDERKLYEKNKRIDMDKKSQLYTAEMKGRLKGLAEGEAKANIENAKKMKKLGMSPEQISEITGLSAKKIEGL
jgi:predicted transposase/invertase (TIGR01784 family)